MKETMLNVLSNVSIETDTKKERKIVRNFNGLLKKAAKNSSTTQTKKNPQKEI
jgi:hypothetical protein